MFSDKFSQRRQSQNFVEIFFEKFAKTINFRIFLFLFYLMAGFFVSGRDEIFPD